MFHYVYAVGHIGPLIKIGFSKAPEKRLEGIMWTEQRRDLVVLKTWKLPTRVEAVTMESVIHFDLALCRVRGEWFNTTIQEVDRAIRQWREGWIHLRSDKKYSEWRAPREKAQAAWRGAINEKMAAGQRLRLERETSQGISRKRPDSPGAQKAARRAAREAKWVFTYGTPYPGRMMQNSEGR